MMYLPLGNIFNPNLQAQKASGFIDVVSFFVEVDRRGATPWEHFSVALGCLRWENLFDATANVQLSLRQY